MKLRDLQQSHDFREVVKKWGEPGQRRRVIVASSSADVTGKDAEIKEDDVHHETSSSAKVSAVDNEIKGIQPEREELKTWVEERKLLREGLNSLSLRKSLLKNKIDKTECEARVLERMVNNDKRTKFLNSPIPTIMHVPRLSAAHITMLPLLDNPLPIALAIIADYLQEHRMRLVDLFSQVDRNKDWLTTREELGRSLKNSGIPLTDSQIDELVLTLDLNNDDQLSYKELAMAIDAYRKDKRWRKLKEIFDILAEEDGDGEKELFDSYNERRDVVDLRLPKIGGAKQKIKLIDDLSAREKRFRDIIEPKRKKKVKTEDGVKPEYITTLKGSIGDSKLGYLHFVDKECKGCILRMHKDGLPTKSEDLVNILIPPTEKSRTVCESQLSSDHSIYPSNHRMLRRYRESLNEKSHFPTCSYTFTNTVAPTSAPPSLPRVATMDFKNRAKEGRKRLEQFRRTSPTPCWPQHLLDKLRVYMETDEISDGKEVLFSQIRKNVNLLC